MYSPRQTARVTPRYVVSVLPGRMLMLYRGHSRTSLPILIYIYICTYIYLYIYLYIYMYIYIICYPFLMSHEMADHFDPRRFFQQCWGRGLPTKKRRGYIYIYIYISCCPLEPPLTWGRRAGPLNFMGSLRHTPPAE